MYFMKEYAVFLAFLPLCEILGDPTSSPKLSNFKLVMLGMEAHPTQYGQFSSLHSYLGTQPATLQWSDFF